MKKSLFLIISILIFTNSFSENKKVVFLSWTSSEQTPRSIATNINFIETLPFDGLSIFATPVCQSVMTKTGVVSYTAVYDNNLKLVQGIFKKVTYNFAVIFVDKPGDFFDDVAWNRVVNNWRMFARAAKAAGLVGIFFDNEEYANKVWSYPADVDSSSKYTVDQYRVQTRLRGKQVMEACIQEFPNIQIMFYHGPYVSETTPSWFIRQAGYQALQGCFFAGMVEAAIGTQAYVVDGGEIYRLRTLTQYQMHRNWNNDTIASTRQNSLTIPVAIRPSWPEKVKHSFGLYHRTWPSASDSMNPTIMRSAMENALRVVDNFVWLYIEESNWLIPPGTNAQPWIPAITGAKTAVNRGVYFTCKDQVSVVAGSPFVDTLKYDNLEATAATLTYTKKPSWITATNGNKVITGTAPAAARTDTLIAIVSANGFSDTLKLTVVVSQYFVIEAETGTISSLMQIGSDPNASGGQYIATPAGAGNTIFPKSEVTYSFNAPIAATYYVWLRVYIQTLTPSANYGTFVGFNGTFIKPGAVNGKSAQYEWAMSPAFKLNAGANTLNLGHGNEQVRIDKIIITNSLDFSLPSSLTGLIPRDKNNIPQSKQKLSVRTISSGVIEFKVGFGNEIPMQLSVMDVSGRTVWSYSQEKLSNQVFWKTSKETSNGLYFVLCKNTKRSEKEIEKFTLMR